METIMYRKREAYPYKQELHTSERTSSTANTPDAVRETGPLSLDLFFSCSDRGGDGYLDALAPHMHSL